MRNFELFYCIQIHFTNGRNTSYVGHVQPCLWSFGNIHFCNLWWQFKGLNSKLWSHLLRCIALNVIGHCPISNNDLLSFISLNVTLRVMNVFQDRCSCPVRATYNTLGSLGIIHHRMFPREHTAPYAPLFGTVCSLVRHWMRGRKLFPGGHPSKY